MLQGYYGNIKLNVIKGCGGKAQNLGVAVFIEIEIILRSTFIST